MQDTNYQTFFQSGRILNFQKGKVYYLLMVNAEKRDVKIKKRGYANLLSPNFYVLRVLSSQLSVFLMLCIMNTLLHFLLLLCQLCRSLRNVSLGGRILGLIKLSYHGWLSMMTSSDGPFLVLPPALQP